MSMALASNEILCLLGASGCGKTTMLKAIAGLLPLNAGKITINGHVVNNGRVSVPPEQRKIGMIFQDYALFPHLTVMQNIIFGIESLPVKEQLAKVAEVLDLVNLSEFADRYPHQLSGGQQQRVAIARAIAYQPDLLLLDEPFSNIDSQVRLKLIAEIRHILKSANISAVFVTHSKEEAFAFADKLAVIDQGKVAQIGRPSELYQAPANPFVADFLGQGNYLSATVVDDYQVDTPIGLIASSVPHQCKVGDTKKLFLRPHQIDVFEQTEGEGRVLSSQFLGAVSNLQLQYRDVNLKCHVSGHVNLEQKVEIKVPVHPLILF
ncbi:ABC transporter ATP-binding protein [Motilimonas pumila]|uniref:ABC transporter ATP-binding protein n=2 Tax=Motilimonas pumila TaxID=2303987 RepID=A0A418Y9X4_9GAMM|nr:ABC transporter ATP-binding protein [Motilimonas pumila]